MSHELQKTTVICGIAGVLLLVTWMTTPSVLHTEALAERGALLYPEFRDPNAATSLEVLAFDERTATVRPLKVQNRGGRWTIPSQFDYPADARDRLAETAAAIIALRIDDVVSDSAADHERCAVIDPADTSLPGIVGRGTRIVVRGAQEEVLADVIIGRQVEGNSDYRYVRQSGQRRIFTSNVGTLNVSTSFADWIERDLLEVGAEEIDAVNLRNYSFDRSTGQINPGETILLQKNANDEWTINGQLGSERVVVSALDALLRNLVGLRIAGVLPKPEGITATLSGASGGGTITDVDRADLARKGFYIATNGQLVSNQGEIVVRTTRGVFYTLRFGEIAAGSDTATSAAIPGAAAVDLNSNGPRESRYLFIVADFDQRAAKTPALAAEGTEKVQRLRARFAPWYYVIGADSFSTIRLNRQDLVEPR